ncbi:MAG: sigma-70 family RNA polymerase sigma factor [Oscillospiraceae bacterium]|jgi:RNA polymerase sigma factor (sigma-70 family)|nr:sigma-70 family RNA polymerase sigma factor [Oscillospiraceae bacterium]
MEKERYVIKIGGELIDVERGVYLAYYSERRRERTQTERDARNGLISYDAWDTENTTGAAAIPDASPGVAERVERQMLLEQLRRCLKHLNKEERELVHALFVCGKSVGALARELNVPRRTLGDRRDRLLRRLRALMGGDA